MTEHVESTCIRIEKSPANCAACLELEYITPLKQENCCSRMFGDRLRELAPICVAVATYAARACEKNCPRTLAVQTRARRIRTGMFNPRRTQVRPRHRRRTAIPTDDTRYITRAAIAGLELIYREGCSFSKADRRAEKKTSEEGANSRTDQCTRSSSHGLRIR